LLPKANPAVIYRALPDGGVLFSPAKEFYFGLNLTGACIWENLHPVCSTIDQLCTVVDGRFPGAEPGRIRRDVEKLLGVMAEHHLVLPS
jgi:hypothetical protein